MESGGRQPNEQNPMTAVRAAWALPKECNACGQTLLLKHLLVDDGCPCNSPRGVNMTPQHCDLCRTDNCVKPAHHIRLGED